MDHISSPEQVTSTQRGKNVFVEAEDLSRALKRYTLSTEERTTHHFAMTKVQRRLTIDMPQNPDKKEKVSAEHKRDASQLRQPGIASSVLSRAKRDSFDMESERQMTQQYMVM